MADEELPRYFRRLRLALGRTAEAAASDADLLGRWADSRDEAAFELLVYRHGPMVLGVCSGICRVDWDGRGRRRVLSDDTTQGISFRRVIAMRPLIILFLLPAFRFRGVGIWECGVH